MGITSEARGKLKKQPHTVENTRRRGKATCKTCGKEKSLREFHKHGRWKEYPANDSRRYKKDCASCVRTKMADAAAPGFRPKRRPGPQRIYKDDAQRNRMRRRETRIKVLRYLAKRGCEHCGTHDPRVLEFDHIDPAEKKWSISRLVSGGYKWTSDILQREIRKCRILCANCHRIHTAEQQGSYGHKDVGNTLREILESYGIEP